VSRIAAYLPFVNSSYIAAGVVHVFNALQYFAAWLIYENPDTGWCYSPFHWIMIPEYLNVIGASLYLASASMYQNELVTGPGAFLDPVTMNVHKIELAGAVVQLAACIGWAASWWKTFPRGRGRGLTLDDPDLTALILLFAPSSIYV